MKNRVLFLAVFAAGCDYGGDFLFAKDTVDDIWILTDPDGNRIVPADVTDLKSLQAATMYGEVGAPRTTGYGGVTFDFLGTGGDVCVWVDPELVYWNQSVAQRPAEGADKWSYPDNVFDDGDLDLLAGQSVYYTGSPGEEIGDFVVQYKDSLGNTVPISLASCPNGESVIRGGVLPSAGRGMPEFCTIPSTDLGIGYTVVLRTWSTPLDDDRLSFGVVIANGKCDNNEPGEPPGLRQRLGANNPGADECVIQGESLTPAGDDYGPFYGFDEVNEAGRIWGKSVDFEAAFCDPDVTMKKFCKDEAEAILKTGHGCEWHSSPNEDDRCYCGDPNDSPIPGQL